MPPAEITMRFARQALKDIPQVAKLDTTLVWYRRLIAQKFDESGHVGYPGHLRVACYNGSCPT